MAAIEKFTFDLSFDDDVPPPAEEPAAAAAPAPEPEPEPEPPAPTFSAEEVQAAVDAARHEAQELGRAEGRSEMQAALEQRIADSLAGIGTRLAHLDELQKRAHDRLSHEAVAVAVAVARKLLPDYAQRHGFGEIEALVGQCLGNLFSAPKVLVTVAPDLVDPLETRITDIARRHGFDGQVMVLSDPELRGGDCRVDWGDGSAERDSAALWQEIEAILARHAGPMPGKSPDDGSAPMTQGDGHER